MTLSSPAFAPEQAIPAAYTCEGDNISPPLTWSGVPAGTQTLALMVVDPDAPDPAAPQRTWVHWVVYNIPATATGLPADADHAALPPGTTLGLNDWGKDEYGGPCPPIGRHRYFFQLYALDTKVSPEQASRAQLEAAMAGHIKDRAELLGTYVKRKKH